MNIVATYEGRPLEALGELIAKRQKLLGESAQQATAATAIEALKSIRALTRTAAGRKAKKSEWHLDAHPQLAAVYLGRDSFISIIKPQKGFKGAEVLKVKKQVTRAARSTIGKKELPSGRVFYARHLPSQKRGNNKRNFWIVAVSKTDAQTLTVEKTQKRIDRYGGLAKNVWRVAMGKIGAAAGFDKAGTKAVAKASSLASATAALQGRIFTLTVESNLDYNYSAMRGGKAAFDLALKRAANKIAGRLAQVAKKKMLDPVPTPFPEIVKRRSA